MNLTSIEKEFLEQYRKLSPERQQATNWILANLDFVNEITRGKPLTTEIMEEYLNFAYEKNDSLAIALLIYKQARDLKKNPACDTEK